MRSYVYLIIGVLATGLFAACSDLGGKVSPQTDNLVEIVTTEKIPDSIQRLKLVFIGDIMQHGDQIRSAFDQKSGLFDYEPCFRYIRSILQEADWAIGNLELTLNDKNDYSGYPRFRSPDALAYYLKAAGFNVLLCANNHSNDNRKYGLEHTLDVLDSLGIMRTGTFRDTAEWAKKYPLILEKKVGDITFKIAILNYTYGTNGLPTQKPNVVNEIDTNQIAKDIEKAKSLNVDMIIACMHWGDEYQRKQYENQEKLADWLWEKGADVVIGSHPHVIQPIVSKVIYNADSSSFKKVLCAYSLGNFISNQFTPAFTDIGLIFEVDLFKNSKTGKTTIEAHRYIPVWRYIHNHKIKPVNDWVHTVIPVSAFEADSLNFLNMPDAKRKEMLKVYHQTQKQLDAQGVSERKLNFNQIVKSGILAPDSVVTNLPKINKPLLANVK